VIGNDGEPVRVASLVKRLHAGGDETRVLTLSRWFQPSRVDHMLVVVNSTAEERNAGAAFLMESYRAQGGRIEVLGLEIGAGHRGPRPVAFLLNLRDGARALVRLVRLLRTEQIDVLDARLEFGTAVGALAARLSRVPVVVATGYSPDYWRRFGLVLIGQAALAQLDALISDATVTLEEYDQWRWSKRARLVLIPNGLDRSLPTRPARDVRAELGLPRDPNVRVIGQVGRLIPRKGGEVFLQAARLVADHHPDTAFVLCGMTEDSEFKSRLEALSQSLGLQDRVRIVGYAGPIGDVLGVLDVFAHLSTFDSSPMAIHESMSIGLPAVVSIVGGTTELVEHGVTGLLVPANDVPAAAAAIDRLLDDRDLAQALGAAARARFDERHSPREMARAHEALYADLLAARRQRVRRSFRAATR
jgi:glycosyltransferase involved in cell wall biosynthesis